MNIGHLNLLRGAVFTSKSHLASTDQKGGTWTALRTKKKKTRLSSTLKPKTLEVHFSGTWTRWDLKRLQRELWKRWRQRGSLGEIKRSDLRMQLVNRPEISELSEDWIQGRSASPDQACDWRRHNLWERLFAKWGPTLRCSNMSQRDMNAERSLKERQRPQIVGSIDRSRYERVWLGGPDGSEAFSIQLKALGTVSE